MNALKRKLAYLLVFAMVLGIMSPGMLQVRAAEDKNIFEDWLTPSTEGEYIGGFDTIRNHGWTIEWAEMKTAQKSATAPAASAPAGISDIKNTAWQTVDDETDALDISWLKKTKDTSLAFRFTKGEDVYYQVCRFNAQFKTFKVGFTNVTNQGIGSKKGTVTLADGYAVGSPSTGYLFFYNSADNKAISPAAVGGAGDGMADALHAAKSKGKKFTFVYYPSMEDPKTNLPEETWPSKAATYSYKKQANAPSVAVDAAKATIGLKKGQEFRISTKASVDYGEWYKVDDYYMNGNKVKKVTVWDLPESVSNKAIQVLTEDDIYSQNLKIQVRTAATSTKLPSKIATVSVKSVSPMAVSITTGAVTMTGTTADAIIGYTVPHDSAQGISIKNNKTAGNLQYAIVATGKSIDADTKWITVKPGAVSKTKTLAKQGYATTDNIYVRIPGVKDKGTKAVSIPGQAEMFKVSDILEVEQTVTVTTSGAVNVTGCSITGVTKATINITLEATSGQAASVAVKLDFKNLTEKAAKSSPSVSGSMPSGVTTDLARGNKLKLTNGSGTINFKVESGKIESGEGTYTITVEEVTVTIKLKTVKKGN